MDKELHERNQKYEEEINEPEDEIIKIKINRKSKTNNKKKEENEKNNNYNSNSNEDETNLKNNEKKNGIYINSNLDKNNILEKNQSNEKENNPKKEEFNLDNLNNFVKQNNNIKNRSYKSNQLLSHLKKKLHLAIGSKKNETYNNNSNKSNNNNINQNEMNNNINKNNENNIEHNININDINKENLKNSQEQSSNIKEIKDKNIESSFVLRQRFNKVNESQISLETNNSNYSKDNKIKKKCKLSLYNLNKLGLLGFGASGKVYLVEDSDTKKKLALKIVKYEENEKAKSQIEKEVKISPLLKHENIIKIYATFFYEGAINFVMEYMDKGTISDLLKKVTKIPEKYVGFITCQVVKGLTFCQKEKRIIHRDLKPSNILVNSKGKIKIADFGVSTIAKDSWAIQQTMIGTYLYMAPERIDGKKYYINCDVWSLGIIVMQCILGYFPYIIYNNNKLPDSIWKAHELIEKNEVPPLNKKEYSPELIDFVNKCLTKDPQKRPKSDELMAHPFIKRYNKNNDDFKNWIRSIN